MFKNLNLVNLKMTERFTDDFISPYEAEHLVQSVKEIDIREYGSKQ